MQPPRTGLQGVGFAAILLFLLEVHKKGTGHTISQKTRDEDTLLIRTLFRTGPKSVCI